MSFILGCILVAICLPFIIAIGNFCLMVIVAIIAFLYTAIFGD